MSDNNDLTNTPGAPLPPWGPKQPLDHRRLNRMQAEPLYAITIRGRGARVVRNGTTAAIFLGDDPGGAVGMPRLHITGPATGGGQYICRVSLDPDVWDSTTDLSADNLGDDDTDDVLLVNLQEIDQDPPTHWLTDSGNTLQVYLTPDRIASYTDEEGRTAYEVNAFWTDTCDDSSDEPDGGTP